MLTDLFLLYKSSWQPYPYCQLVPDVPNILIVQSGLLLCSSLRQIITVRMRSPIKCETDREIGPSEMLALPLGVSGRALYTLLMAYFLFLSLSLPVFIFLPQRVFLGFLTQ
jgi:hypothetical protein